jgi:hypothetical protein
MPISAGTNPAILIKPRCPSARDTRRTESTTPKYHEPWSPTSILVFELALTAINYSLYIPQPTM